MEAEMGRWLDMVVEGGYGGIGQRFRWEMVAQMGRWQNTVLEVESRLDMIG